MMRWNNQRPGPPPTDLLPVTVAEMIQEVERELTLRRRVYPSWVAAKRLAQSKADRQIEVLEAVLARLKGESNAT
jgi:hypothetical protein